MYKVSIIVPAYNVEKYLTRCMESLLAQTLQEIEIILVDDGSTDRTAEICNMYANKYIDVEVVHKRNGGLSSARNAGLRVASGQYVGFVDSDDEVDSTMFELLYQKAIETGVDYVFSDYIRKTKDGRNITHSENIPSGCYCKEQIRQVIFPQLIMRETIEFGPCISVWNGLYRKRFLDRNNLFFDEEIKWSEDNLFSSIAVYLCNSLYYMKNVFLYHYWENPGSITTSYRKGAWDVYCKMNQRLHEFFDSVYDYDFTRQMKLHLIYFALNCIQQEKRKYKHRLSKETVRILNSSELRNTFEGFDMPHVHWKLKVILLLMKQRSARLLTWL